MGNDCNSSCNDKNHAVAVVAADGSSDPLTGIVQIGVGAYHVCALTTEGSVVCWGAGSDGQLGNQGTANKDHPVSVVTSGGEPLTGIVQIEAGEYYACALTGEGEVLCWGENASGELGDKSNQDKNTPVNVVTADSTPLGGIVQISAGFYHACALTNKGEVQCWGYNAKGQLGDGSTDNKNYAVAVVDGEGSATPLAGVVNLSSGQHHTCALSEWSGVRCWGLNNVGSLGDDTTTDKVYPVAVVMKKGSPLPLSGIVEVSSGKHGCALMVEGEVRCWGYGLNGRLGNGATDNHSAPVAVLANSSGDHFHLGLWRPRYACYEDGTCKIERDFIPRPVLTGSRSDTSATPEVKVLGLTEGASVTLHTDGSCSGTGIGSGTVATGESSVTITPTTSLTAKYNRIYAKIGELCSKSGADYTFENGAELMTGEALSHDHTPTLTVASTTSGDELSLHTAPDCSDAALASATASGTSETLEPTLANHGRHTLYLKQNGICHPRGFDYSLVRHMSEKPTPISGGMPRPAP